MAQSRSARMQVVLRLAGEKEKALVEALGKIQQQVLQEQQQKQQLESYRQDYIDRQQSLFSNMTRGADSLRNYSAFMANLDHAIEQQQQQLNLVENQLEQVKQQWFKAHSRCKNLTKLVDGYKEDELKVMEAQLQREIDDRPKPKRF